MADTTTPFIDQSGEIYDLPKTEVSKALQMGFSPATAEDIRGYEDQKKYGEGILNPLLAGAAGAASTLTFGGSDQLLAGKNKKTGERLVEPETLKKLEEYNPTASLVGQVGGAVLPSIFAPEASLPGLVGRVGEATTAGAKALIGSESLAARMAASAAGQAVEGGAYGLGNLVHEEALGDANFNAESILANVGTGALFGGGLGAAIPVGSAALSGTKKAFDSLLEKSSAYTEKLSSLAAQKVLGITRADAIQIKKQALDGASEQLNILKNIPQRAMEKGILDPFISTEERLKRAWNLRKDAGGRMDEAIGATDKNLRFSTQFLKDQLEGLGQKFKNPLNEDELPIWNNLLKTIDSKGMKGEITLKDVSAMRTDLKEIAYPGKRRPVNPSPKQQLAKDADDALRDIQKDVVSLQAGEKVLNILKSSEEFGRTEEGAAILAELQPIADLQASTTKLVGKGKKALTQRVFDTDTKISPEAMSLLKEGPDGTSALERAIEAIDKNKDMFKNVPKDFEALKKYPEAIRDYHTAKNSEKWLVNKVVSEENRSPLGMKDMVFSGVGAAVAGAPGAVATYLGKKAIDEYGMALVANMDRALKQVREFTTVDKVLSKMNKATADNIRSFMEGAKKVTNVGPAPLVPHLPGFDEVRDRLNEMANSFEVLQNNLDENPFKETMPNTTSAMNNKKLNSIEFLKSKLPVQQQAGAFGGYLPPSKSDLYSFYKYLNTVNNPLDTLFHEFKEGSLQPETVETIKAVYPDIYKKVSIDLLLQAGEDPEKLTYKQKLQLSLFFGYDMDGTLTPEAIQANQMAVAGMATAQNQGSGGKPSVAGMREMQKASAMLTPMQRLQMGQEE